MNLGSAWLLSGGNHHHGHSHGLAHGNKRYDHDQAYRIATDEGVAVLEIVEDGVPPRFRLRAETGAALAAGSATIETVRPDGKCQLFALTDRGDYLESVEEIPEPHAFTAHVQIGGKSFAVVFAEHEHAEGVAHRDNNMRVAVIHVMADATVSILVIF